MNGSHITERLYEKLYLDALTKLKNRWFFEEYLKFKDFTTCHIVDIDNFKKLNDTHGHLFGDRVLKGIANVLSDVGKTYEVEFVRFGGEEFLCLSNLSLEKAVEMANEILRRVRQLRFDNVKVTVSIGLSVREEPVDAYTLIDQADKALYRAKESGKDRFVLYDSELKKNQHLITPKEVIKNVQTSRSSS